MMKYGDRSFWPDNKNMMISANHEDDHYLKFQWTCTQQIEEELNQANMNLQTAGEQIGDLNLQVTILTSGKET